MENPIKMDDLGVPLFLETSISEVFSLLLQIPCEVRCLGTQNPLQNHLQKGLEHKGLVFLQKKIRKKCIPQNAILAMALPKVNVASFVFSNFGVFFSLEVRQLRCF